MQVLATKLNYIPQGSSNSTANKFDHWLVISIHIPRYDDMLCIIHASYLTLTGVHKIMVECTPIIIKFMSCNWFVGSWPPSIIGLHPTPSPIDSKVVASYRQLPTLTLAACWGVCVSLKESTGVPCSLKTLSLWPSYVIIYL